MDDFEGVASYEQIMAHNNNLDGPSMSEDWTWGAFETSIATDARGPTPKNQPLLKDELVEDVKNWKPINFFNHFFP